MEVIQNKVAESGILVFNLEDLLPDAPVKEIDLANFLAGGFILKEKPFRKDVAEFDFAPFQGAHVGVICSSDAIIPTWAFMLIASRLNGVAASVTSVDARALKTQLFSRALEAFDWSSYQDKIVVIKGCGSGDVPASAYVEATGHLPRFASKIMYGEPCSSVPIWRRPASK